MSRPASSVLGRSFDVYYRDAARTARMDKLNAQFIGPGDLAFDIGAHVGDRTGSFLRLGASAVVVEPQPRVFRALRLLYGRRDDVVLTQAAVGAAPGELEMFVNSDNPTISTASAGLVEAAQRADQWQGQVWDSTIRVPVTTLDQLVADHGVPAFIKIDVEGLEYDVLRGLTSSPPALSFEFTTIQRDIARHCIEYLGQLGRYAFNVSFGEEHRLVHPHWIDGDQMTRDVMTYPDAVNSGDIYARLVDVD